MEHCWIAPTSMVALRQSFRVFGVNVKWNCPVFRYNVERFQFGRPRSRGAVLYLFDRQNVAMDSTCLFGIQEAIQTAQPERPSGPCFQTRVEKCWEARLQSRFFVGGESRPGIGGGCFRPLPVVLTNTLDEPTHTLIPIPKDPHGRPPSGQKTARTPR